MTDDDRIVRVDVSKDLLSGIEDCLPRSAKDYLARLYRHKRRFEEIAAAKYRNGQYTFEVRVRVVSIAAQDLA